VNHHDPQDESQSVPVSAKPLIELIDAAIASSPPANQVVLDGVTWRVNPGDYWVIGGLPGSGKTELLLTAAGLAKPARGQHRLLDQDLQGLTEPQMLALRLQVGLVFAQGARLFHQLTILQNVALPICYRCNCAWDDAMERVEPLLIHLELLDVVHRLPGQVSRAARQRAGLARALSLEPEVLLLDNPLSGLDRQQTMWWLDFLDRLAAGHEVRQHRPVTVVVTTDDFHPWRARGRQFAFIRQGRWLPLGGRAELEACTDSLVRTLLAPAVAAE
jgi:ABC-type transporter Mla maintaining outer membrane lipid asymmetry ATPase subunit MlaF